MPACFSRDTLQQLVNELSFAHQQTSGLPLDSLRFSAQETKLLDNVVRQLNRLSKVLHFSFDKNNLINIIKRLYFNDGSTMRGGTITVSYKFGSVVAFVIAIVLLQTVQSFQKNDIRVMKKRFEVKPHTMDIDFFGNEYWTERALTHPLIPDTVRADVEDAIAFLSSPTKQNEIIDIIRDGVHIEFSLRKTCENELPPIEPREQLLMTINRLVYTCQQIPFTEFPAQYLESIESCDPLTITLTVYFFLAVSVLTFAQMNKGIPSPPSRTSTPSQSPSQSPSQFPLTEIANSSQPDNNETETPQALSNEPQPASTVPPIPPDSVFCEACNLVLKEKSWNAHVKTDKHARNKSKMPVSGSPMAPATLSIPASTSTMASLPATPIDASPTSETNNLFTEPTKVPKKKMTLRELKNSMSIFDQCEHCLNRYADIKKHKCKAICKEALSGGKKTKRCRFPISKTRKSLKKMV
jgi:hypothetical protein